MGGAPPNNWGTGRYVAPQMTPARPMGNLNQFALKPGDPGYTAPVDSGPAPAGGWPSTTPTGTYATIDPQATTAPTFAAVTPKNAPYDRSLYSADAQQFLDALPHPSQINARNFSSLNDYHKQVVLSGYSALGYDPQDITQRIQNSLPGVGGGPTFGLAS